MPLYKCEVTFDIVVDTKDEKEAVELADKNIYEEISNTGEHPIKTTTRQIININDLSKPWLESVPWNGDKHDRTCLDILMSKQFETLKCCSCKALTNLMSYSGQVICKECAIKTLLSKGKTK